MKRWDKDTWSADHQGTSSLQDALGRWNDYLKSCREVYTPTIRVPHHSAFALCSSLAKGAKSINLFPATVYTNYFHCVKHSMDDSSFRDWCAVGSDLFEAVSEYIETDERRVDSSHQPDREQDSVHSR